MVDDQGSWDKARWKLVCLYRQQARPQDVATLLSELGGGRLSVSAQRVLLECLFGILLPVETYSHDKYEG